jgi:Hemerythrin HHE cation binding domain
MLSFVDTGDLPHLRGLLDRDHARLLALLADVQFLCGQRSFRSAARVFAEFRRLEELHLAREEALVSRLTARQLIPGTLVTRVTDEHAALRALIERTWQAVSHDDEAQFQSSMTELSEAVDAHERGEKEHLLPALTAALASPGAVATEVRALVGPEPGDAS